MAFLQQKPGYNLYSWPVTPDIQTVRPIYAFHGPNNMIGHHPFVIPEEEEQLLKGKYAVLRKMKFK